MRPSARIRYPFDPKYIPIHFRYDKATGELFWNVRRSGRKVGRPAGTKNAKGHIVISLLGDPLLAENIVWAMMTGKNEFGVIDHKNGDKTDNRFENLQELRAGEVYLKWAAMRELEDFREYGYGPGFL